MRIRAFAAYYKGGRYQQHEAASDAELLALWDNLPADGALAFKLFFDKKEGAYTLAQNMVGNDWYWLRGTPEGVEFGHSDDSKSEIEERYPGALLKRGQWTSPGEMATVAASIANLKYWMDTDPDIVLGGCGAC
jgi:hypothetical protein